MAFIATAGGMLYAGPKRHYRNSESIFVNLTKQTDGQPYTTAVVSANLDPAHVLMKVVLPDGNVHTKSASAPEFTMVHAENAQPNGHYRVQLWGETIAGGHDVDLAQAGEAYLVVAPVGTEFNPICVGFTVETNMNATLGVTWAPGPSNTDLIRGCLGLTRWHGERFDFPITATGAVLVGTSTPRVTVVSSLLLKISDADNANILTLNSADDDFTEGADGSVYFEKAIAGLTGNRALTARVQAVYKGKTFDKEFPLQLPDAA